MTYRPCQVIVLQGRPPADALEYFEVLEDHGVTLLCQPWNPKVGAFDEHTVSIHKSDVLRLATAADALPVTC